jgi:hypothetical protein
MVESPLSHHTEPVSELSKWGERAESIAASGRWAAANDRIKHVCAYPPGGESWRMQVVASLCAANFAEYLALKAAHADLHGASSLIAWRARNLLELSVWAVYCGKSVQNAQRFFTDAGRDVLGLFDAFSKWIALSGREWSSNVAVDRAKADLLGRAAARGIDSLDGSYKPVSAAAKEIGMGDPFLVFNKLLSKFAHPTAMQVLAGPDDKKTALQRDAFFYQGCLFFVGAFEELERQLSSNAKA